MKNTIYCLVAVVLVIGLLLGCAPAPAPAGPIEIKAVCWSALGRGTTKHLEAFYADMVKERSNGELIINLLGGPEVIPYGEQIQACREGIIDMVFAVAGETGRHMPEVSGFHLSPTTPWEDRTNGIYDYWVDLLKQYDVYYLGRWSWNKNYHFHLKDKRIETLADFEGLQISPLGRLEDLVEAFGAVNVRVSSPDIYTSMTTGMIDGYIWGGSGRFSGWEEVTKYFLEDPIMRSNTFLTIMNLAKWNSVPKHLQEVLIEVSVEYEQIMAEYYTQEYDTEKQKWLAAGCEYIHLPPDDAEWMSDTAYAVVWARVEGMIDNPERYAKLRKILLQQ